MGGWVGLLGERDLVDRVATSEETSLTLRLRGKPAFMPKCRNCHSCEISRPRGPAIVQARN